MTDSGALSATSVSYGGVYQAVCLELLTDQARVQIPQIFATEIVVVYDFAGPRPDPGDTGWIMFESGLAERPVWVGSESKDSSTAGPPGPPGGTFEFTLGAPAVGTSTFSVDAPTLMDVPTLIPKPGELRMNSTNQATVTEIYVSTQTVHGVDITDVLLTYQAGFHWYLYDKRHPDTRMEYLVLAAPINNGAYFTYSVSLVRSLGPLPEGPIYCAGVVTAPAGGGPGGSYHHYQTTPATTWTIIHNLPFFPNVSVVDSSGREVVPGAITYTSPTVVTLTFSAAFGGDAYLS